VNEFGHAASGGAQPRSHSAPKEYWASRGQEKIRQLETVMFVLYPHAIPRYTRVRHQRLMCVSSTYEVFRTQKKAERAGQVGRVRVKAMKAVA